MKIKITYYIVYCLIISANYCLSQNIGMGTVTPESSAMLDIYSTSRGFLPPRMNTVQRNAIINPADGLIIYNITSNCLEIFSNKGWSSLIVNQPVIKKLIGGSGSDIIKRIFPVPDGGLVMAGYTNSNNNGTFTGLNNNGGQDGWILKLDATGNIQWQNLLGGTGTFDFFYDMKPTGDGGFIISGTSNSSNTGTLTGIINNGGQDGWLLKIDSNGNTIWQKLFGGDANDYFYSVVPATDGGFVAAGTSYSSNTGTLSGYINNGATDGWIVKTDANGNILWQKLLGGDVTDAFNYIIATPDNGLIVSGFSSSNSGTGTLTGLTNYGAQDGWIIKTNAAGDMQWQKMLGGTSSDIFNVIQTTSDNAYLLGGYSSSSNTGTLTGIIGNGMQDGWLVKTDLSGNIQFQKLLGGNNDDKFNSLLETTDEDFIIIGLSSSSLTGTLSANPGFGGSDGWILKINTYGNIKWQQLIGGSNTDELNCIIPLTDGNYIFAGISASANNGTLSGIAGYGGGDVWIFKTDMYGNAF